MVGRKVALRKKKVTGEPSRVSGRV